MQRFVFLLILSFHSPAGSESLLLLRQKKEPRKGDPEVTVAARLPCDARANGPGPKLGPAGLRHRSRTTPIGAALLGVPYGREGQKQNQTMPCDVLAFDFGAPAAPPRSAGEAGAFRPLCLSRAAASLRAGPLCRAPQGTPKGRRRGCVFFAYFLCTSKESESPPQGDETQHSRESKGLAPSRGVKPRVKKKGDACGARGRACNEIASSASPPRHDIKRQ